MFTPSPPQKSGDLRQSLLVTYGELEEGLYFD